ncbi:MAG: hypothetical protein IPM56_03010 [Ignavibacteriales bacterium]|nr:MAG: hypothetical protein IPM56_03010 [Ignavibacteriales bacterium]
MRQALFFLVWGLLTIQLFSKTVYITPSGKKYHTETCVNRGNNSSAIDLKEAVKKYESCNVCKPLVLSSTNFFS